jgi:hypothetical protein
LVYCRINDIGGRWWNGGPSAAREEFPAFLICFDKYADSALRSLYLQADCNKAKIILVVMKDIFPLDFNESSPFGKPREPNFAKLVRWHSIRPPI